MTAREAGDQEKVQRLKRIRNDAIVELARHAERFALLKPPHS